MPPLRSAETRSSTFRATRGGATLDGIGALRWRPGTDTWSWNDALFRLLGYAPRAVTPSRALLLAHTHPDDRDHTADRLSTLAVTRVPFCHRQRLVTAEGRTREVVGAVGHRSVVPEHGGSTEVRGWVIALFDGPEVPAQAPPRGAGIPVPRGRGGHSDDDGHGGAAPLAEPALGPSPTAPWPRPAGAFGEPALASHAELLHQAQLVLVAGLGLDHTSAGTLLSHLANTHEVPPVSVAEGLIALDRDEAGRPDLPALLAVLDRG